jgi:hypothetical protein
MVTDTTESIDISSRDPVVVQKAQEAMDYLRSVGWGKKKDEPAPKSWFVDPFQMLDSMGLGYRQTPGVVTYDTLLQMTERDPVIAAIIQTRIQQVISFMQPQPNKYSIGFKMLPRDWQTRKKMSAGDRRRCARLQKFLLNTGVEYNRDRDDLEMFAKKFVRDSLTWDQATFEKVRGMPVDYGKPGKLLSFTATPSASMRIAYPKHKKGTPLSVQEARKAVKYAQVVNGKIVNEYTSDELAFCVRNPRANIDVYGYGYTELEMLLNTITAHLWAEEWNRRQFSNGATIKGLLNVKGNVPNQQLEAFRRQWAMQVAGVANAHRTPVLNAEGVEWFPLQLSNTEMGYQVWLEYLIKVACACFQMDPSEINFDLRGGAGVSQPMFMTTNEAQQKLSKDRGLRPLLRFIATTLNRQLIWEIDDRYEIEIIGLDAKSEEQAIELRLKEVQNYKTVNEVREEDDREPIEGGDIILNAVFTGNRALMQQQAQGAPQGAPAGAQGAPGGQQPPQGLLGAPGAPGGGPGNGQQPQPQQQAVEFRPNAVQTPQGAPKTFDDEEQHAGKVIQEKNDESSAETEDEDTPVFNEDWESSVHASLRKKNDLNKSSDMGDFFISLDGS